MKGAKAKQRAKEEEKKEERRGWAFGMEGGA
jgi:hypothetical protein